MVRTSESVGEALALESEAAEEVDAAVAEKERGSALVSIDLLLEAIDKERASLDLLEQGVETLRQGLDHRRRAIEQQQEMLNELAESLTKEV